MIKIFFVKILIVIFTSVLQFAFLPRFGLHNYINLLLPLLIFWVLLEKYTFIYFTAFLGGIIFDLFSGLPLGSKTILYIILVYLLILARKNLVRSFTPMTFAVLVLLTIIGFVIIEKLVLLGLGFGNYFTFSIFVEIISQLLFIFILSFFIRKKLYS